MGMDMKLKSVKARRQAGTEKAETSLPHKTTILPVEEGCLMMNPHAVWNTAEPTGPACTRRRNDCCGGVSEVWWVGERYVGTYSLNASLQPWLDRAHTTLAQAAGPDLLHHVRRPVEPNPAAIDRLTRLPTNLFSSQHCSDIQSIFLRVCSLDDRKGEERMKKSSETQ